MHSTTFIGGHGTSMAVTVDGVISIGKLIRIGFYAQSTDPSYHGAIWTEAVKPMGPIAYIIKARVTLLRDLGSAMSVNGQFIQGW